MSWLRKKDIHILASENFVFSGDQRFSVLHQPDLNEWNLKIESATQKDSGVYESNMSSRARSQAKLFVSFRRYECQVNTEPKIKLSVLLEVTGEDESCKRKVCCFRE